MTNIQFSFHQCTQSISI